MMIETAAVFQGFLHLDLLELISHQEDVYLIATVKLTDFTGESR